jgi:hypothetical protein
MDKTTEELKEGLRALADNIKTLLNDFEEEFDFRTAGVSEERDPESRKIIEVIVPIFEEKIYV